jgi:Ca-activated chloride channel homolog
LRRYKRLGASLAVNPTCHSASALETCGGSPCDLGKELHASAAQLTVHIIGYRIKDFSWTGEQSILDAKCLAEENGGLYISTESKQELIEALEKTCPDQGPLSASINRGDKGA